MLQYAFKEHRNYYSNITVEKTTDFNNNNIEYRKSKVCQPKEKKLRSFNLTKQKT